MNKTEGMPLREQRKRLALLVTQTYSADNFPGSRRWWTCKAHQDRLDVFDGAHPEIIAAIKVEQQQHDQNVAQGLGWI